MTVAKKLTCSYGCVNRLLTGFLLSHGFLQSPSDAGLFFLRQPGKATVFLLMYVDDLQIACAALQHVTEFKHLILSQFPCKDLRSQVSSGRCLFAGIMFFSHSRFLSTTSH
jgi:hypothetical protein